MKSIDRPSLFDWDKGNLEKNWLKHQVGSHEAEEAFSHEPILVSEDLEHSKGEKRFRALGKTNGGRLLFISFTIRGDRLRIISVRDMNRKEESIYEAIKKDT